MICLPLKWTSSVDLETPIRDYIKKGFESADHSEYSKDLSLIQNLRNEIRHSAYYTTWRDILYRYLLVLDHISPKFCSSSKGEDGLNLAFTWEDTITLTCTEQRSFAHEKAGVLFNLAAVCSGIACAQDRETEDGLKTAYVHFQLASSILERVGCNFMYPAALDLTSEAISMFSTLQLAQAQECMLEKAISSVKASSLLAKLASQLEIYYTEIVGIMESPTFRPYIKIPWIVLSKSKLQYFGMLSNYHLGLHYESLKNYGASVGYLNCAASQAKLLKKYIRQKKGSDYNIPKEIVAIPQNRSSARTHSTDLYTSPSSKEFDKFMSNCHSTIAIIETKCAQASKDNSLVYHQQVPKEKELDKASPLAAVKPEPFQRFFAKVSADFSASKTLFSGLVTDAVLNEMSSYTEERDRIINEIIEVSKAADVELHNALESSSLFSILPGVIEIIVNKRELKDCVDIDTDTLQNLSSQIKDITRNVLLSTPPLKPRVSNLIETLKISAAEISRMIDDDNVNYSIMKAKYQLSWIQEPLSRSDYDLLLVAESRRAEIDTFTQECKKTLDTLSDNENDIESLKDVEKTKRNIVDSLLAISTDSDIQEPGKIKDVIFSSDDSKNKTSNNAKSIVLSVSDQLELLKNIKNERLSRIEILKRLQTHDTVKEKLMLSTDNSRELVVKAVNEYKQNLELINTDIKEQKRLIKNILSALKKLDSSSDVLKTFILAQNTSKKLVKSYIALFNRWKEAVDRLVIECEHMESLKVEINNTRSKLAAVTDRRIDEAKVLQSQIERAQDIDSQEDLRKMIDKFSLTVRSRNMPPRTLAYPIAPLPHNYSQQQNSSYQRMNVDDTQNSLKDVVHNSYPLKNNTIVVEPDSPRPKYETGASYDYTENNKDHPPSRNLPNQQTSYSSQYSHLPSNQNYCSGQYDIPQRIDPPPSLHYQNQNPPYPPYDNSYTPRPCFNAENAHPIVPPREKRK